IEVVTDEVRLHVEDELPGQALGSRLDQLRSVRFGGVDLENVGAIDFLHGEKGGGHTTPGRHELSPTQAKLLGVLIGQFENPPLDTFLRLTLSGRKIFTIGNDLRRYGRRSRGFLSPLDKTHFSVAKPTTHRDSLPIVMALSCRGVQLRPWKLKPPV